MGGRLGLGHVGYNALTADEAFAAIESVRHNLLKTDKKKVYKVIVKYDTDKCCFSLENLIKCGMQECPGVKIEYEIPYSKKLVEAYSKGKLEKINIL